MDWWAHRIASSQRYSERLRDLDAWTMREVLDAHRVLDAFDRAELEVARRARAGGKGR